MLEQLPRLEEIPLINQRVLVRADLDLAVDAQGNVADSHRLRRILPTLRHIVEQEGRLILAGHRGDPRGKARANVSLEPVGVELAKLTGWEVLLPDAATSDAARMVVSDLRPGQVCLLENLRFEPGEDRADEGFARNLARLCDVYVLDALSLVDRELASIVALPRAVRQRTVGFALRADLEAIERLRVPTAPVVALVGGRRLAEQLDKIEMLLERSQVLCLGGGVANTFLAATGHQLGRTRIETDMLAQARALLERTERAGVELVLPTDVVVAAKPGTPERTAVPVHQVPDDRVVVDLGPETVQQYAARATRAATVIATGPMGLTGSEQHTPGESELYARIGASPVFSALLGGAAAAAARAVSDPENDQGPTFDLVSAAAEPVWRLIRGARLPGLQSLR
jgi:phosphoglycerate kinase